MKKVAIIKDALRNMPHLILLEEDQKIKSIPITEFGKKIAEHSVGGAFINTKSLPDGFVLTKFVDSTSEVESLIAGNNFEEDINIYEKSLKSQKIKRYPIRVKNMQKVAIIGISEKSLTSFKTAKERESIIDFKARLFSNRIKTSSIIGLIKSGRIGFDSSKMEITSKKSLPLSELTADLVKSEIPAGVYRRAFYVQEKGMVGTSSKRINRRVKSLLEDSLSVDPMTSGQRIYSSSLARLKKYG